jgi:hypothetical protein
MIYRVECRSTRMGAVTRILSDRVRVVSRSRTGRHWVEEINIHPGEHVPVVDISNTGRHNCYYAYLENGQIQKEFAHHNGRCLICDRPTK